MNLHKHLIPELLSLLIGVLRNRVWIKGNVRPFSFLFSILSSLFPVDNSENNETAAHETFKTDESVPLDNTHTRKNLI